VVAGNARSIRGLQFLLRSLLSSPRVAVCVFHLSVAVAGATVVVRIEFFSNLGFGFGLEVFINTLVVLVGTTTIRDTSIITGSKIVILKCCCKNCS
jgi:hypothetical protein